MSKEKRMFANCVYGSHTDMLGVDLTARLNSLQNAGAEIVDVKFAMDAGKFSALILFKEEVKELSEINY